MITRIQIQKGSQQTKSQKYDHLKKIKSMLEGLRGKYSGKESNGKENELKK